MRDPAGAVYRTRDEVEQEKLRDPIVLFRARVLDAGLLAETDLQRIEKDVNDLVDEAVAFADASPEPSPDELFTDIYREEIPEADRWR
jgi:pyruvate dehydrogenase E1 component alpha subunit